MNLEVSEVTWDGTMFVSRLPKKHLIRIKDALYFVDVLFIHVVLRGLDTRKDPSSDSGPSLFSRFLFLLSFFSGPSGSLKA